jgi:excisionase family DNA binding protein
MPDICTLLQFTPDEFRQILKEVVTEVLETKLSQQQEEKLLTVGETCKLLNISKVTLSTYTKAGKVKEYRIGSRVLYKHAEIMTALTSLKKYTKKVAA